jgi:hypothetical protein
MKKITVILFLTISIYKAQVVFSPPGAEWNYNFFNTGVGNPAWQSTFNEKIKYARDTVINSITYKVLTHSQFFLQCSYNTPVTVIKQSGDTIFMRNARTQHNWEIPYNFNVSAGGSWQTKVLSDYGNPILLSYTISVYAVSTVTINNISLKRLITAYSSSGKPTNTVVITERFGSDSFLFNYYNTSYGFCDGQWFTRFLCYSDPQFENTQFSTYPCDYNNLVGVDELKIKNVGLKIYPNPSSDFLVIEQTEGIEDFEISLKDVLGKELKRTKLNGKTILDVHDLKQGIYFVELKQNEKLITTEKIIKK